MSYCPDAHLSKASFVWMMWIPVRTFLYVEKLRTAPACIRPDDSAARPEDTQCLTKASGFPSKTQIWGDRCNRPEDMDSLLDVLIHKAKYRNSNPDVRTPVIMVRTLEHQIWKLRASDQPSGRPSSWSGRAIPLYGNNLQRTCDRLDDRARPSERGSFKGIILVKFSDN
jgi:hypothetical protein